MFRFLLLYKQTSFLNRLQQTISSRKTNNNEKGWHSLPRLQAFAPSIRQSFGTKKEYEMDGHYSVVMRPPGKVYSLHSDPFDFG